MTEGMERALAKDMLVLKLEAGVILLGLWAAVATISCVALAAGKADAEGTLSACEFNKGRVENAYEMLALAVRAGEQRR